jgi:hypothetical protein
MTTRVAHQRSRSAGRSCSAGSRHRRGLTCASPASRRQRCIQLHRRRQFSNRACAQVATDTVTARLPPGDARDGPYEYGRRPGHNRARSWAPFCEPARWPAAWHENAPPRWPRTLGWAAVQRCSESEQRP